MISIIMCTYNGERFILEQLESLLYQTRKADEVLIFDDCSTDGTVAIINDFIAKNPLSGWTLTVNQTNKGWRKNFYDAMYKASGDIIFFCDQDDIWNKTKIEVMSDAMLKNPSILSLTGGRDFIDAEGIPIAKRLKLKNCKKSSSLKIKKVDFFEGISGIDVGCMMAIRRQLLTKYLHGYNFHNEFSHDTVCSRAAILLGRCYTIDFSAIKYRLHRNNQSTSANALNKRRMQLKRLGDKSMRVENSKWHLSRLTALKQHFLTQKDFDATEISKKNWKTMNRYIGFHSMCVAIREKGGLFRYFKVISYIDVYFWKTKQYKLFISDLLDSVSPHIRQTKGEFLA